MTRSQIDSGHNFTRRHVLGGTLAVGGFLLAGCQAGGSSGGSASNAMKTLRVAIPSPLALSQVQKFSPSDRAIRRTVFDVLVDRSADGTYKPALAKSWEWSKDKKTLVLKLESGVTYHTGRDFGPQDVIDSIAIAKRPASGVQEAKGMLGRASAVKKTGSDEVTVTFDKPFSSYLGALAMLPMVDSKTYSQISDGTKVIGTGPFTWKSQKAGVSFELGRNDSYWEEGKPYFAGLSVKIMKSQAMSSAMAAGDLDLAIRMVGQDASNLLKQKKFAAITTNTYEVSAGVNTSIKPFDDKRVRQAVAYSIDRDRISKQVYSGFAKASCVSWPTAPGVTQDQDSHYTYDIAKAKSLLQQANAMGAPVEIAPLPSQPSCVAAAQVIQYGLSQAGFKPKILTLTAAKYTSENQSHTLPALWIGSDSFTVSGPVPTLTSSLQLTADANSSNFTPAEYKKLVQAVTDAASQDQQSSANKALVTYMLDEAFHNVIVQAQEPIVGVKGLTNVRTDATMCVVLTDSKLAV